MEPTNTESGPSTPEKQEYFNKPREAVAPFAPTSLAEPTCKTWKKAGRYRDYHLTLRRGFQSLMQYIYNSGARPINNPNFS